MAHFLFVDESDPRREGCPCEVLGGLCVEDRDVWNLIEAMHVTEEQFFGMRYSQIRELKGKKILKRKVFRLASQMGPIDPDERTGLAKQALLAGDVANRSQITALAQAKIAYVSEIFNLCGRYRCNAFASIVCHDAPRPTASVLRKDYTFLFERFFYFLEDRGPENHGIIVFDELEKSRSHILLSQMEEYFLKTNTGKLRSRQVIPQPFFVHSDLTTLIQVADLLAYTIAWGWRKTGYFDAAKRPELEDLATQAYGLRYTTRRGARDEHVVWSFCVLRDLRGRK